MTKKQELKQSALIIISALAGTFLSIFLGEFMKYSFPLNIICISLYTLLVFFVVKWFINGLT